MKKYKNKEFIGYKLKIVVPHTQKNVCVGVDKFLETFLKI